MSVANKNSAQGTGQVQVKAVYRLTNEQYQELERKALAPISFRDDTPPVQSGYLNGVESVLRLVRRGFTV